MRFGSLHDFAIEAEFQEVYGKWIYGRLRLWLCGTPFGDFDDTSDLATSARWGRVFLAASSRRTRPDLDAMTAQEVFELLYGRHVVPVHSKPRGKLPGPWDRDPYLLDDVGESALRDKVAIVVVRRADGSDRVLAKTLEDDRLQDFSLAAGLCDRVVDSYCTWVEGLRAAKPS